MSFPRRGAAGVATLTALAVTVALTACSAGTAEPATAPGSSVSAGGRAGSPAVVPSGTAGSALGWSACGSQLAGMECASLQVPLNYADPGGRKITIALSMVPATAPKSQQQGVMLVNPGGPGAPGRWLAGATATSLSPQVAADYDIVGFDPRGVGGSVPALSCDPGYFSGRQPDYIPANAAAEQVLINKAKTYAADCEQRFGWLLPYETSVNMARDMDLIRQAFGVQKITYYGFSWGTYLGQVYGTLFPSRV
ncbi:MAG: alpha/beta fold hydrolase, partial [Trebonia sp.]